MNATSGAYALTIAKRLLTTEAVLAAVPGPEAASLAHGLAGTALLHARLATIDPVFRTAADSHWAATACRARRQRATGSGIFTTAGGLAASLIIGTGYLPDPAARQLAAAQAAAWLSRQAQRIADDLAERRCAGDPCTPRAAYDAINGLAGIGRVLLAAVIAGHPAAERGLIATLEALTMMIVSPHGSRPGWWLPAAMHPPAVKADPSGSAATGMAHGIAGPLACLAAASARGWSVPGQDAAIRHASRWLLDWKAGGTWQWPASVSGTELDAGSARPTGRQDAWCYGTPGISAALSLAGQALGDGTLTQAGEAAIASLASRPACAWDVEGPTLCHGHAGVLACAADRQPGVSSEAAGAITAVFDASHPFALPSADDVAGDRPGFLVGAAGAALTLAEHGHLPSPAVPARWDCVLLLS
ncbi:MAG: lanthionine synthetase C family protein [Trebonia sp.]